MYKASLIFMFALIAGLTLPLNVDAQEQKKDEQKQNQRMNKRRATGDRSRQRGRRMRRQNGDQDSNDVTSDQTQQRMLRVFFLRNDKNSDGFLTVDELPERQKKQFDRIDQNQDKKIDNAELAKAFAARLGRGGQNGKSKGRQNQQNGMNKKDAKNRKMDPSKITPGTIMRTMDKNGDQVISKDEANARLKKKFDEFDADGNQELDKSEVESMFDRLSKMGDSRRGNQKQNLKPQKPKRPPADPGK